MLATAPIDATLDTMPDDTDADLSRLTPPQLAQLLYNSRTLSVRDLRPVLYQMLGHSSSTLVQQALHLAQAGPHRSAVAQHVAQLQSHTTSEIGQPAEEFAEANWLIGKSLAGDELRLLHCHGRKFTVRAFPAGQSPPPGPSRRLDDGTTLGDFRAIDKHDQAAVAVALNKAAAWWEKHVSARP